MKTRIIGMLAVTASAGLLLSACGTLEEILEEKAWEPGETALWMNGDGTVTETILDQLDQGYYSDSELEKLIQSSVSEFNQKNGADSIRVDELTLENHQVALTMTYRSAEDYAQYNNVAFYNGSMLEAEMEGFLFYNEFRKVEKGKVTEDHVSNEEALKHKEYQVLITDMSHAVQVPGAIRYVSFNAQPLGERQAGPVRDGAEASQDDSGASEADLDKSYMYILYDY